MTDQRAGEDKDPSGKAVEPASEAVSSPGAPDGVELTDDQLKSVSGGTKPSDHNKNVIQSMRG